MMCFGGWSRGGKEDFIPDGSSSGEFSGEGLWGDGYDGEGGGFGVRCRLRRRNCQPSRNHDRSKIPKAFGMI